MHKLEAQIVDLLANADTNIAKANSKARAPHEIKGSEAMQQDTLMLQAEEESYLVNH